MTKSFNQSAGAIGVAGNVGITQAGGSVTLGDIATGGTFEVTAANGNITQLAGINLSSTGISTLLAPSGKIRLAKGNTLTTVFGSGDDSARAQVAIVNAVTIKQPSSNSSRAILLLENLSGTQFDHSFSGILTGLNVDVVGQGVKLPSGVQTNDATDNQK